MSSVTASDAWLRRLATLEIVFGCIVLLIAGYYYSAWLTDRTVYRELLLITAELLTVVAVAVLFAGWTLRSGWRHARLIQVIVLVAFVIVGGWLAYSLSAG